MRLRLEGLLHQIQCAAGDRFTGVGLIITSDPDALPIVPLRAGEPAVTGNVIETLAAFSVPDSPFHDGFHVLSPGFEILRAAQYFSPPIVPLARIDRDRFVGGRYVAALFGSALTDVKMTGVASAALGVSVFEGGVDVSSHLQC